MNQNDFMLALTLYAKSIPFHVLIMAAILTADEQEEKRVRKCFPEIWQEVQTRSDLGRK